MNTDEGGHKNKKNYNQRASPGKKIKADEAAKADKELSNSSESEHTLPAPPKPVVTFGMAITAALIIVLSFVGG